MSSKARAPPGKSAGAPSTKGAPTLPRSALFPRDRRPATPLRGAPALPSWLYYGKIFGVATALTTVAAGCLYTFNDMKLKQLAKQNEEKDQEITETTTIVPAVHGSSIIFSQEDLAGTVPRRKGWFDWLHRSNASVKEADTDKDSAALQKERSSAPVGAQVSAQEDAPQSRRSWFSWTK